MKHFGKGKIIEMVNKPAAARDSESGKLEKVRQEVFFFMVAKLFCMIL